MVLSCTVDYDVKPKTDAAKIALNCILNPKNPIKVYFFTVEASGFHGVNGLNVKLSEDGETLFEGRCQDTVLILDTTPRALATYRIEASLEGFQPVWAETSIPDTADCNASLVSDETSFVNKVYLTDFKTNNLNQVKALYISAYSILNGDSLWHCDALYANNSLIDRINRQNGIGPEDEEIGNAYYDGFMRVKADNFPILDKLVFDPRFGTYYGQDTRGIISIITASDDYDRYIRSLYHQSQDIVYDDILSSIIYQPVRVFSNLNGGLGIFAGVNEIRRKVNIPH